MGSLVSAVRGLGWFWAGWDGRLLGRDVVDTGSPGGGYCSRLGKGSRKGGSGVSKSGGHSDELVGRTGKKGGIAEKPTWGQTHQEWHPSGWGSDDLTSTPPLP